MDSLGSMECIEETGRTLNKNNQGIVKYLCGIQEERNNLEIIIKKQFEEKEQIESDIEKLTFKLCLINKSLAMRIKTKNNYDKTIEEIKANYEQLVASSNKLKQTVEKTQADLDSLMNKKTGTGAQSEDEEIKVLYVKSFAEGGEPTKEERPHHSLRKWNTIVGRVNKDSSANKIADLAENKAQANERRMTNNEMKPTQIKVPLYSELTNPSYSLTSEKVSGSTDRTSDAEPSKESLSNENKSIPQV